MFKSKFKSPITIIGPHFNLPQIRTWYSKQIGRLHQFSNMRVELTLNFIRTTSAHESTHSYLFCGRSTFGTQCGRMHNHGKHLQLAVRRGFTRVNNTAERTFPQKKWHYLAFQLVADYLSLQNLSVALFHLRRDLTDKQPLSLNLGTRTRFLASVVYGSDKVKSLIWSPVWYIAGMKGIPPGPAGWCPGPKWIH